jgi:thioredoxin 1
MRLLKFEAPWCTRCEQMTQTLNQIDHGFYVEHINVDENREAAIYYGIRGIPHMIVLDENNNIVKRIGGVLTKQQLQETLKQQGAQ